jgi:hypothetical protein
MRRLATFAVLPLLVATPALAAPHERCDKPEPGLNVKVTIGWGHRDAETQELIDKMLLKQRGVDAQDARMASDGCLMVTVPTGNGHYAVEYYDPDTYELKPEIGSGWRARPDALGIDRLFLSFD